MQNILRSLAIISVFFIQCISINVLADTNIAILQGLDKVTARISKIDAVINQPIRFGTLLLTVRACQKAPPEETPEVSIFVEVSDIKQGVSPVVIFTGWMFASSPALSALEHPVYDVWAFDCAISNTSTGGVSAARP